MFVSEASAFQVTFNCGSWGDTPLNKGNTFLHLVQYSRDVTLGWLPLGYHTLSEATCHSFRHNPL